MEKNVYANITVYLDEWPGHQKRLEGDICLEWTEDKGWKVSDLNSEINEIVVVPIVILILLFLRIALIKTLHLSLPHETTTMDTPSIRSCLPLFLATMSGMW